MDECSVGSDPSPDCGNQRIGPGPGLDLSEVKQRRKVKVKVADQKCEIGKSKGAEKIFVGDLSISRWTRSALSWVICKGRRRRGL